MLCPNTHILFFPAERGGEGATSSGHSSDSSISPMPTSAWSQSGTLLVNVLFAGVGCEGIAGATGSFLSSGGACLNPNFGSLGGMIGAGDIEVASSAREFSGDWRSRVSNLLRVFSRGGIGGGKVYVFLFSSRMCSMML